MRQKLVFLFIIILILFSFSTVFGDNSFLNSGVISAEEPYYFEIPKAEITITIHADGIADIEYYYEIINSGREIKFLWIGLHDSDKYYVDEETMLFHPSDVEIFIDDADISSDCHAALSVDETYHIGIMLGDHIIKETQTAKIRVKISNIRYLLQNAGIQDIGGQRVSAAGFIFDTNDFGGYTTTRTELVAWGWRVYTEEIKIRNYLSLRTEFALRIALPDGVNKGDYAYYAPEIGSKNHIAPNILQENGKTVLEWRNNKASLKTSFPFGVKIPIEKLSSIANIAE